MSRCWLLIALSHLWDVQSQNFFNVLYFNNSVIFKQLLRGDNFLILLVVNGGIEHDVVWVQCEHSEYVVARWAVVHFVFECFLFLLGNVEQLAYSWSVCWFLYIRLFQLLKVTVLRKIDDHPRKDCISTEVVYGLYCIFANLEFETDADKWILWFDLVLLVIGLFLLFFKYFVIKRVVGCQLFLDFGTLGLITHLRNVLIRVNFKRYLVVLI